MTNLAWIRSVEEEYCKKLFEKFEKCEEHMRKASLKHFQIEFQLVENKIQSIEKHIQSIQHQSGTNRARQIVIKSFIAFSINQAIGSIDRKSRKLRF